MLRKLIQTCLMISVAVLFLMVQRGGGVARTQIDYQPVERVLASYVDEHGYVDYAGLKKNPLDLDTFIGQISQVSPASHPALFPTREAKLTYWINAHNAWMLRLVVDHYPVKKVTSIGLIPHGVFLWRRIRLGGRKMSLRHLENEIIRKQFGDPRIHFALNCASIGCPRLPQKIFHPKGLKSSSKPPPASSTIKTATCASRQQAAGWSFRKFTIGMRRILFRRRTVHQTGRSPSKITFGAT